MPPENLESRVNALEVQVGDLRGEVQANKLDVTAVQALVVAVDRDVSQMSGFRQATIATMNALREDMVDMRQNVVGMREDMTGMRGDLTGMKQDITGMRGDMIGGFSEMRAKFDMTAAGQQRIVELIQTVIDPRGDNGSA